MDKMIVYEDNVLLIVHKPVGIATETAKIGQADLVSELKNYRKKKGEGVYIGVVHRLDQPVEGLLVFAKNAQTARKLSDELQKGNLTKKYAALTAGVPQLQEGELTDFLLKDGRTNLSMVVPEGTKGAKEAALHWKLLKHNDFVSLLEIELYTGRHHQIRTQMANAGFPLLGDFKYGSASSKDLSKELSVNSVALLAHEIQLIHPVTGKKMEFLLELDNFMRIF
ncbi:MAG: RluA family pseudouridine synthase [Lachnospiraceae bacterium]|nr:RluA family pseudouridine synthase [Lachnospiraceae bacterium]